MRLNKRKTDIIVLLFVVSLLIVLPIQMVKAQAATVSVSPQNNPVSVGQALTINVEISNIQNLYGVDITLNWDTSMLKLDSNQSFVGVSNGVLNAPVLVVQDTADQSSGQYHLVATSENPAGPFSGSATIATLTFTVTSTGQSKLTINPQSQLASYAQPGSGEVSQPISFNIVNGNVYTGSSSSSPSASQTPSSSHSSSPTSSSSASSSPSSTSPSLAKSPAFAVLLAIIVIVVIVLVTLAVAFSKRRTKKNLTSS